ncbi:MAG: alpha/beta hydrolase [Rhodospirillales bacterium]|nr:alpha/beta hydrolase [Rhodospirillales bacterium]
MRALLLLSLLLLGACTTSNIPMLPGPEGPGLADEAFVAEDGAQLPLHRWTPPTPPRAIVLALHGMNDYGRAFATLGRFLAQRGVATYAYDQRGFGGAPGRNWWPGTEPLVRDFGTALDLLRRRHPGTPVHCLGESMGAAVIILALARQETRCASAVLSAPAVWGKQVMPAVQRAALALAEAVAPDMVLTGAGLRIRASDNIAALRALQADPMVLKGARVDAIAGLVELMTDAFDATAELRGPALWLYGKNDQIIAQRPTLAALRRLPPDPQIRIARYPLGYHLLTRDLDSAVVAHDIASWLFHPGAPLPSGADRVESPRTEAGQASAATTETEPVSATRGRAR